MRGCRIAALACVSVIQLSACYEGVEAKGPAAAPREIVVRPSAVLIRAGETAQLSAQVNDSTARPIGGASVAFATDSMTVIRVSSLGLISTVGPVGRDSVIVTSGTLRRVVPVSVSAGVPRRLDIVAGGDQVGSVASTLGEAMTVRVSDAFGNPVARAPVQFSVQSGGTVEPNPVSTDASGLARASWSLGPIAGRQSMEVRSDSASAVIEATALPGPLARLERLGQVTRRVNAGDTLRIRLRATDDHGNGVARAIVAFTVTEGGGDVSPSRLETGEDGVAEARLITGRVAGRNTLKVVVSEVHDITQTIELRTFAGAPARLTLIAGANQRAPAGSAVRTPPSVRVFDAYGNVVAGMLVRFSASAGGTVEPQEALTDARGVVSVRRWTLGSAGENTLAVACDALSDTLRVVARAR